MNINSNEVKSTMISASKFYNDFISTVSKEEFCSYCDNHVRAEIMEHFNIPFERTFRRIASYFEYDTHKRNPNKGKKSKCSHEDYLERGKKSGETQKKNWESKTQEEKDAWSEKQSLAHLNSPTYRAKISKCNTMYRLSLTEEEKTKQNEMRSESMKKWWNNLSEDERNCAINKHFNGGAGYHTSNSQPNVKFMNLLCEGNIPYSREHRIGKFSYDFKVDDTLIEINPTATHNSTWSPFGNPLDKNYHKNKSMCAKENGLNCIHVFDWDDKQKVIELLKCRETIYARQCIVKAVDKMDAKEFINTYHLQGYARDTIRIGLYYNNDLVSIMTFGKPRYNKNYQWELIRYCSCKNVIGGAEKLFKHFTGCYDGSVISYCDISKFNGTVYEKLGFELIGGGKPSKHWYNIKTKQHITDNLLRQRGYDQLFGTSYGKGTSNEQLMLNSGFVEIYDCGQSTYVYKRE